MIKRRILSPVYLHKKSGGELLDEGRTLLNHLLQGLVLLSRCGICRVLQKKKIKVARYAYMHNVGGYEL